MQSKKLVCILGALDKKIIIGFIVVILATFAFRLFPISTLFGIETEVQEELIVRSDAIHFHEFALQIKNQGVLSLYQDTVSKRPDVIAFRVPIYPMLVSIVYSLVGVYPIAILILNIFFEVGTAILIMFLIWKVTQSIATSLCAGLLYSVNYYGIYMSGALFADIFLNFLFVCVTVYWYSILDKPTRKNYVVLGALLAVLTLTKPIGFYLTFLLLVLLNIFARYTQTLKEMTVKSLMCIGVFFMILAPWQLRNYMLYQHYSLSYQQGFDLLLHRASHVRVFLEGEDIITARNTLMSSVQDVPNYFHKAELQQDIAISYLRSHINTFVYMHMQGVKQFFFPNPNKPCILSPNSIILPYVIIQKYSITEPQLRTFCNSIFAMTTILNTVAILLGVFLLFIKRYRSIAIYFFVCALYFANVWGIASYDMRSFITLIPLSIIITSCGLYVLMGKWKAQRH